MAHASNRLPSSIASVLVFALFGLGVMAIESMDTCTMGGDGLFAVAVFATPVAALACVLIHLSSQISGRPSRVRFAVLPLALVFSIYFGSMIWQVTVLGNHNCGPEYNEYLEYRSDWERVIPIYYLGFVALAAYLVVRPYVHKGAT